jgi:hypothetical protein
MTPLTDTQLDEIAARAASLYEYATLDDEPLQDEADRLTGTDVPALLDENRRLRAQLEDQANANTVASRAAQAISRMGADLRAMTSERNRYRSAWRNARARAVDARSDVEFVEQHAAVSSG